MYELMADWLNVCMSEWPKACMNEWLNGFYMMLHDLYDFI